MAHTDRDEVIADYIWNLINNNKVALQLDEVLYGNHNMITMASAAVITAMGKRRRLSGVSAPGGRTENDLIVIIAMHWSKVGDEATERRNADNRARLIENKLHEDTTLGGNIIHGYVTEVDRGESEMATGSMFRSVRMTYVGTTKTYLSPPAAPP